VPLRDEDYVDIPSTDELQQVVLLVGAIAGANAVDEATSIKRLPLYVGDTVRTIIDRSGGLGPAADLQRSYIRRGEETIPLDLEALMVRREFNNDKPVKLGDSIVVPYQRRSVIIEGAVLRPGVYQYNPEFRIEEYIATAGGMSHNAQDIEAARLVTQRGQTNHYSRRMAVSSGDTIVVPERGFTRAETAQLIISGVSILVSTAALVWSISR